MKNTYKRKAENIPKISSINPGLPLIPSCHGFSEALNMLFAPQINIKFQMTPNIAGISKSICEAQYPTQNIFASY